MRRPEPHEYNPAYGSYVERVPETNIVEALEAQTRDTLALFASIDEERARHRYAPGKWSITQIAGHTASRGVGAAWRGERLGDHRARAGVRHGRPRTASRLDRARALPGGMTPFVIGERFRRRRRPRRPTDDVPSEPIFELVAFWMLLMFGSLFAALAIVGAIAALFFGVEFERVPTLLMIVCAIVSPLTLWGAMIFWFRMKR